MNLPKGSGLEQLRNIVSSSFRQYKSLFEEINKMNINLPMRKFTLKKNTDEKGLFFKNPMKDLMKSMTDTIAKFTRKSETEDYNEVLNGFIPAGAQLLTPDFPRKSGVTQLADLDGDTRDELIATYKHAGALKTIILRKQADRWFKVTEINHPEHDGINLRSVEDISGDGRLQLLIGLSSKDRSNTLYGYTIGTDGFASKSFGRNYDWAEITTLTKSRSGPQKAHIALWNRDENGTYDIDLLAWNGLLLEPAADIVSYYARKVVPYYMRKARQNPTMHSWYRLADSLKRAGAHHDAYRIATAALRQGTDQDLKNKFTALL